MKKHLWAVLAMMLALCVPMAAYADEITLQMLDAEGNDVYDYGYIWDSGTYTVQGRDPYHGIVLDYGLEAVLFLNGAEVTSEYSGAGLDCTMAKKLTIVLKDGTSNLIQGGNGAAGIWNGRTPLEIYCESAWNGEKDHICDDSCGYLEATSSNLYYSTYTGAGIGGGMKYEGATSVEMTEDERNVSGCNITIYGGNIYAQGGAGAAGIGGGCIEEWDVDEKTGEWNPVARVGNGTDITIVGGNVTAIGGIGAAGIGGAMNARLLQSGPFVENMEEYLGGSGRRISITGGSVYAEGGELAPGIGGGYLGKGEDILITGGEVYAQAGVWDMPEPTSEDEEYNGNGMPEYMPVGSGAKLPGDDVTPDSSNIRIAPKSGTRIRAGAGNSLGRAAEDNELKGSPFTSGKDITDQLKGKTWFATMTEDAPNTVQPSTGDGMGAGFWVALLMLSAAAYAAFKRRTA